MAVLSLPSYSLPTTLLLIAAVALLSVLVHDLILYLRCPPGPRPLPFIGNKLQIPKQSPWIQFEQWSKTYGPIFTIWIGRRPTIVISDPVVAVELLEKRSNNYSSRPRFVAMGEIYWDMASILVQPYGKQWSVRRKLLHSALTPRALALYKPVQEAEASRLCLQLMQDPSRWEQHFDRYTSSIVFSVSYGHRIDSLDAKVIRQRLEFMQYAASLNVPGAYLVESLPWLKHVPTFLAPWKAEIRRRGRVEAATNMALVDEVKADLAAAKSPDDVPDSLTKLLLTSRAADPAAFALLSDRDFSYIPATLFGAGSDTTASTMCSAVLALVTHPEALAAAQAEVDAVVVGGGGGGERRSPSFGDLASLPYVRALCHEVLRWRPVAVLGGTPHASVAADTYRGYHIPAGTTILSNSWAINLNADYYANPHHFNPLRFLDVDPASLPYLAAAYVASTPRERGRLAHPSKDGHSSFGWGRRICPGAGLAQNSLTIAIAKLVWAFDIKPVKGETYDIFRYTQGFNIRPQSFRVDWVVRDSRAEVLESEARQANAFMEKLSLFKE